MSNKKLAIVGIFYDGYYDIWEDFLELFSTNWPDCPYPLYVVNNEKDLSYSKNYNVRVLHAGKEAEYSRKVQLAVKEIDADYYLLLLEDFFIQKKLTQDSLNAVMEYIIQNSLSYYRMQIPDFLVKRQKGEAVKNINANDEYTLTCQPSIWERAFLEKCIGSENYNAWIFEGIYALSKTAHTSDFLKKCRVDYSNPLTIRHGAVQGKLLPSVYEDFKTEGYIFKNNREVLEKKAYEKHKRKQKLKKVIPLRIQKILKSLVKTSSVLDRYRGEILITMKKMNIE